MGSTFDAREFRRAMGLFATGVTVVAAEAEGTVHGMTANAFTSVSLDPPLVLVCVNRPSVMADYLRKAGRFSVNFLREDQEAHSQFFARAKNAAEPAHAFVPWEGTPRLEPCLASVACSLDQVHEAGDHDIFIGRVEGLHFAEDASAPLLFFGGRYRRLDGAAES